MPLDTSGKRRSSVASLGMWQLALPSPTDSPGTIDQADREHGASTYSGILAVELELPIAAEKRYWGQRYFGGAYWGGRYWGGLGGEDLADSPIPSKRGAARADTVAVLVWALAKPDRLPVQLTTRKRSGIPGYSVDTPVPRLRRQNPQWPLPYVAPQRGKQGVRSIFIPPQVDNPPITGPRTARLAPVFVWHLPPPPFYGVQPRHTQINPELNIPQVKALKVRTDRIPLLVWGIPAPQSPAVQPRRISDPVALTPLPVNDPPPKDLRTNTAIGVWFLPQPWPKTANGPYVPIIPEVNDPPPRGATAKGIRAVYVWPGPLFPYTAVQIRNQNVAGIPGMSVDDPPVRGTRWRERYTRIASLESPMPQYVYIPQIAATLPVPDNPPFGAHHADTIPAMLWNIAAQRAAQGMNPTGDYPASIPNAPTQPNVHISVMLGNFPREG